MISVVTVKSHGCCLPGARVRDRAAAVVFAFDHGVVAPGVDRVPTVPLVTLGGNQPPAGLGGRAMADRPEVLTASAPITALSVVGLAGNLLTDSRRSAAPALAGPSGLLDNIGRAVTRQVVRSLMGYSMGLPIEEFRSMEKVLDDICQIVMPPFVGLANDVEITEDVVGGVPGLWCRAKASTDAYVEDCDRKEPIGATGLYLHGGGYIGTSPMMYSAFAASLVRVTGAEIFIADYRMAPEFLFPAGVLDAAAVYEDPSAAVWRRIILWWPVIPGGGGLAASLMIYLHDKGVPAPAALVLFSPRSISTRPSVGRRQRLERHSAVEHPVTRTYTACSPTTSGSPSCTPTLTPTGFRAPSYAGVPTRCCATVSGNSYSVCATTESPSGRWRSTACSTSSPS